MQIATADWHGPVPNVGHGGRSVRLVVVHIMSGTLEGTDAWFHNPASQVSADTGTGKDGRLWQWDDPAQDIAWAQANYNAAAISIENEGQSGDQLTTAQIARCGEVLAWAHKTYGVPLAITGDPNGTGLIGHGQLGVAGGNHPNCPGQSILDQFPQIIAAASGAVQEDDVPYIWISSDGTAENGWYVRRADGDVYTEGTAPFIGGANTVHGGVVGSVIDAKPWKDEHAAVGFSIVTLDANGTHPYRFSPNHVNAA